MCAPIKLNFLFCKKKTALVKSETTSKDTNSSQALRVLSLMKSANSPEFLTVWSVFPTTGDKVLAREPEIAYIGEFYERDDGSQSNSPFMNFRSFRSPLMKAPDRSVETLVLWIITSSVTLIKSVNQSSIKPCLIVQVAMKTLIE